MLPLDLLRVPFARAMHLGIQMPGVGAPMIGVIAGQPEGLEQRLTLQKDVIFAATKDVRRMSSPSQSRAALRRAARPLGRGVLRAPQALWARRCRRAGGAKRPFEFPIRFSVTISTVYILARKKYRDELLLPIEENLKYLLMVVLSYFIATYA